MNLKKVLCAALSTVTAVSLLASCGGKGKMQMDKSGAYRPEKPMMSKLSLNNLYMTEVCRDRRT